MSRLQIFYIPGCEIEILTGERNEVQVSSLSYKEGYPPPYALANDTDDPNRYWMSGPNDESPTLYININTTGYRQVHTIKFKLRQAYSMAIHCGNNGVRTGQFELVMTILCVVCAYRLDVKLISKPDKIVSLGLGFLTKLQREESSPNMCP